MGGWAAWHEVFKISLDGLPAEGKPLVIECRWHDGAVDVAHERVTRVEPPARLCWDYEDMPDWLLGTERCIELSEVAGDGGGRATRIRNYEHFFGPLAPFVWLHRGRHIQRGFTAFNRDLGCVLEPRTCGAVD